MLYYIKDIVFYNQQLQHEIFPTFDGQWSCHGSREDIIKVLHITNVGLHLNTTETYYIYKEMKKGEPKLMTKTPPKTAFFIY